MGYTTSGLIEVGSYSGPKTTVGIRLAMERGEYRRIRAMDSAVPQDVKEGLTIYRLKKRIDAARAAKANGK